MHPYIVCYLQGKVVTFKGMWQIHALIWKFSKLSNSGISLNWSIIDEVTTRNTTAYFLAHSVDVKRFLRFLISRLLTFFKTSLIFFNVSK